MHDASPLRRFDELFDSWCASFNAAAAANDGEALGDLFGHDSYWRDILTLDDRIQTARGPDGVRAMFAARSRRDLGLRLSPDGGVQVHELPGLGDYAGKIIRFESATYSGRGYLRIALTDTGRAFALLTAARELNGHPEKSLSNRDTKALRSGAEPLTNWLDRRRAAVAYEDRDPEVLVIGAGHAGLAVAARLQHLDVDTLLVDRTERVGDVWRNRYHSLTLHNQIALNHMPYMPFPVSWPVYLPKDKLAGWLEYYAEAMELNVWNSTTFLGGEYDEADGRWTVRLARADGTVRTMRPSHVIMAIGVSGIPSIPTFPGQEAFEGRILHSSQFGSDVHVAGKSVVVVGAGTSAHDIAHDVHLRGGRPVLVQRSSVTVTSVEQAASALGPISQLEGVFAPDDIDLLITHPFDLVRRLHLTLSKTMAAGDAELLRKLDEAGFLLDNGDDDTGFFMKLLRSLSGYYLNVGASDLIIDGSIALKTGVNVASLGERSVRFSDGSEVDADLVVLGTGYRPLQDAIEVMFGLDVAQKVGPIWGIGPDQEMMGMWGRTGQPGFFLAGGTFPMSRFYSAVTALSIKRDLIAHEGQEAQRADATLVAGSVA